MLDILFIDDDEIERLKFNRVCKQSSYKTSVIEAKNGEEAIILLEQTIPQLVIVDLNMPKMNGLEFISALRKNIKLTYMPIVVLSSSDNKEDVKKCFEVGVSGYILKPLRYEEYKLVVENILAYWCNNELIK